MKKTSKESDIYDHIDFTQDEIDDVELPFDPKSKEYNF